MIGIGIGIWVGGGGRGGPPLLAAPADPTLTLLSGATDNQPDFLVTAAAIDLPIGAVVTIYAYSDVGLTTLVDTGQGTVAVAGTVTITDQLGPLADHAYWYNADTAITGHTTSGKSNTQNNTIDATPPTLSSATGTKTGTTTADLSVSTNETNGTLFGVVTTSATPPSKAQVKAGQDNSGSAASLAFSQAVSASPQTKAATVLPSGTTLTFHSMQEDAVGNQSNVATSAPFTTDAASTPAIWDSGHKGANVALSNANRTAAHTGGGNTADYCYSTAATTAGQKVYVETTWTNWVFGITIGFGVDNTSTSRLADSHLSPSKGVIVQVTGGVLCADSVDNNAALVGTISAGDTVDFALDVALGKLWVRKNNGAWNASVGGTQNPATGQGGVAVTTTPSGPYYFFYGADGADGDSLTAIFASASWARTAPSGFTQLAS